MIFICTVNGVCGCTIQFRSGIRLKWIISYFPFASPRPHRASTRLHRNPAFVRLTTCMTGCRIPLLSWAPNAVPVVQPIFSNMARPLFSVPSSGSLSPTTSPSLYLTFETFLSHTFDLNCLSRHPWAFRRAVARKSESGPGVALVLYTTGRRASPLPMDLVFKCSGRAISCIAFRNGFGKGGNEVLIHSISSTWTIL